ncbi:hypothetical protein RZQ20_21960 [Raoultella ornithinolytica]|uniref:hypothetical protein n=1 Tax=Raoultella ornithinolytica TaxID=54291 RepID=UPI00292C3C78|nr:hypothetical protein [Raoultella ornithinolytica]MDV1094932.1 hypothetical protein [Raoultella ornithinolytica]MDV1122724.1 hypothetical protein [Raoultella ornithinolytica]MDV1893239.1 hypothetical protein [Raoultella ornithinolytica]
MFNGTNVKLQQLAIQNKVPAWCVMVDLRRTAWENTHREVLVVLGENGNFLSSIEMSSYDAWGRTEAALKPFPKAVSPVTMRASSWRSIPSSRWKMTSPLNCS